MNCRIYVKAMIYIAVYWFADLLPCLGSNLSWISPSLGKPHHLRRTSGEVILNWEEDGTFQFYEKWGPTSAWSL